MKFRFNYTSGHRADDIEIEINTLEELLKLLDHENLKDNRYKEIVVGKVDRDFFGDGPYHFIEIYDDYRE